MRWRQEPGDGEPEHGPDVFGDPASAPSAPGARNPRLAGFTAGGEWDACAPGAQLAAALAAVSGPEWRCPGAEPDELIGVLRRFAALESWAAAAKLGVIRELIRQDMPTVPRPRHGDLPDSWSDSLNQELALALASSVGSAQKTALTAWELGARLPGIAALLEDGTLSYGKAKMIAETFQWLSDDDAARAEALLVREMVGGQVKTYGQLMNLTTRIAVQVDPGFAERRRKAAERHGARVSLFREESGAAGLSGRDLPTDEALAANASVCARAAVYKESGAFGDALMDRCRATAYLDLINQVPAEARIAHGRLAGEDARPGAAASQAAGDSGPGRDGSGGNGCDGSHGDGSRGDDSPGPGPGAGGGPGGSPGPRGIPNGGQGTPPPSAGPAAPRSADLVIPLATLLGLAERPGEGHGLGTLDPDLCRHLAATAVNSPRTELCVTVTDSEGIAIGHGCGRRASRTSQARQTPQAGRPTPASQSQRARGPSLTELPARLNLTVTTTLLAWLAEMSGRGGRPRPRTLGTWGFTRDTASRQGNAATGPPAGRDALDADAPDGYGTWTITLPDGRTLTVRLEPVPTFDCDHRYESPGYQPGGTLRHLVQVRDYVCTNPVCNRHARESDFEHALPYDKGGRTCACNAGARSRKCHRVKQSPGWKVTQPRPGWHQWETPSGRTYTRGPYQYPV